MSERPSNGDAAPEAGDRALVSSLTRARLWIGNVAPEASDDALVELVKRYCRREGKVVQHVDADGARPGRILEFTGLKLGELDEIARRVGGLYWQGRSLTVYHMLHPD